MITPPGEGGDGGQRQGEGSITTEEQWEEGSKEEPCTGELASSASSGQTLVPSEGLGDRLAEAMMEERRSQGSSRSSSEIVKVRGKLLLSVCLLSTGLCVVLSVRS